MKDFYCPEHRYNPPDNSGFAFCPKCEIAAVQRRNVVRCPQCGAEFANMSGMLHHLINAPLGHGKDERQRRFKCLVPDCDLEDCDGR